MNCLAQEFVISLFLKNIIINLEKNDHFISYKSVPQCQSISSLLCHFMPLAVTQSLDSCNLTLNLSLKLQLKYYIIKFSFAIIHLSICDIYFKVHLECLPNFTNFLNNLHIFTTSTLDSSNICLMVNQVSLIRTVLL